MSVCKWLVTTGLVAVASLGSPRAASADWVLTPFVGWNFSGSADVRNSTTNENVNFEQKIDYGVSLTGMGAGVIGFEVDFGYSPNFLENGTNEDGDFDLTGNSNMTTLTGNMILGIPIGGTTGGSVRPYGVGGVGLMRSNVGDVTDLFDATTKNDFGFDVGGGVMGFFNDNVGLRGDVRYFRTFRGTEENVTGLALGNVNFWRGSVGLSLKF